MNTFLKILFFYLTIHCSLSHSAQETSIDQKIVHLVSSYATAISCDWGGINSKSIAALVPYKNQEDYDSAKYAVLWSGDIGCLGGSGSVTTNIAIVIVSESGQFVIDPSLSSPAIKFQSIDSRFFPKIISNTSDALVLEGMDYDLPKDSMCCPSIPVQVTVKVNEKGDWKVIDKKVKNREKMPNPSFKRDTLKRAP
ncbi:MAG: hypothetical protein ACKVN9_09465 [Methylophilaceae bacterium]